MSPNNYGGDARTRSSDARNETKTKGRKKIQGGIRGREFLTTLLIDHEWITITNELNIPLF